MKEQEIADQLWEARINKQPILPISRKVGSDNLELAYNIQNLNTRRRLKEGARITGKKIGLTSKVVQKQLGVNQPDFGMLFHDMEVLNGASMSVSEALQPKAEAEIAFVLQKDLDKQNLTTIDIIDAIAYALPAIEIVGSRVADWKIKIMDTIADNASASHYVVGHTPLSLSVFDVVHTKMSMKINDKEVATGSGNACLGSPINATLWLAQKMVTLKNPLKAGEVIFSGALGSMVEVKAGDNVTVTFDDKHTVSVYFEE